VVAVAYFPLTNNSRFPLSQRRAGAAVLAGRSRTNPASVSRSCSTGRDRYRIGCRISDLQKPFGYRATSKRVIR
jgi:hypothetical protein